LLVAAGRVTVQRPQREIRPRLHPAHRLVVHSMTVASLDHHGRKVVLRWRIASLVSGRSLLLGPFFYLPRGEGNGILANLVFAQWTTAEVAILGMVALHVNDYEIFHVGLSRSNRKIKGEIGEMFCCAAI
jgi:hypothetical protein